MPEFRPIPDGAVGPRRTVAPSTTPEAMEESLPTDMAPRSNKPLVRKTPKPRPRSFSETISMDTWEAPPEDMADVLGLLEQ